MHQIEIDQPTQVEGGHAMREPLLIALDAAEADPPVAVGDEPGNGALDHGAPSAVLLEPDPFSPLTTGGHKLVVMGMDDRLETAR